MKVSYENNNPIGYFALLDSGADECIFKAEIAKLIGIKDITTGIKRTTFGIVDGVEGEYFLHKVKLNVGGWNYDMEVGFMPKISKMGYGVLGQKGFF